MAGSLGRLAISEWRFTAAVNRRGIHRNIDGE
jgi:hypothetical protein